MKTFSWDIGTYCNFRCFYCSSAVTGEEEAPSPAGPRTPGEIEAAWKEIFGRYGACAIFITGGEPFAYPRFADIVARLARCHTLHITTNLSRPLDEFLGSADPSRVALNATFHPLYMDPQAFLDQAARLRRAGFSCDACYLAHPVQLREMLFYKKLFLRENVHLTVTEFWGAHGGKEYPREYSDEERSFMTYVQGWQDGDSSADGGREEDLRGPEFPAHDPSRGRRCAAGSSYAAVTAGGDVKPCGQAAGPALGNIYDGGVSLLSGPMECAAEYCRCRESAYCQPNEAAEGESTHG